MQYGWFCYGAHGIVVFYYVVAAPLCVTGCIAQLDINGYLALYFLVLVVGCNHRFVLSPLPVWSVNCNAVLLWKPWHCRFLAAPLCVIRLAWILIDTSTAALFFLMLLLVATTGFFPQPYPFGEPIVIWFCYGGHGIVVF